MMDMISAVLDNPSHSVNDEHWQMGRAFSTQLIPPHCKMELFRRSLVPAAIRRHNSKCDTFPNPLPLSQNSQAQCSYLSNGPNIQTLTTENGLSLLSNDAWTLSMNCILVMVTVITEDQDTHCVLFPFFFFFCNRSLWQPLEPVLQCRHKVKRWRCIHIIYNFWIVRLSEMK